MITFAEWVRQRRKALDLTQTMLAQRVGCAVVTIKKIEQEMRRPSRELAELLADHLAVPAVERNAFLRMARGEYVERSPQTPPATQPPSFEHIAGDADRPPSFVAREQELAQLETHLVAAFNGSGRIIFVTGEAGRGKTTLMVEFARRAQTRYPNLVVASGNCEAYAGTGDPYLPFRDVLTLLTGGVEAKGRVSVLSQEQARRLWMGLPHVARALVDHGPSLLDIFVPIPELMARLIACPPQETRGLMESLAHLEQQHAQRATWQQRPFVEHYTQVLCKVADRQPLLLLLDDLQWTDRASAGLLFHLGRRMSTSRILILGAYRPSEVPQGLADGEGQDGMHPLAPIVHEFKRRYGDIELDLGNLAASRERAFVDALLDREPNRLGEVFRAALFRRTGGHPLFTVELLREMQERQELVQDEAGQWVEGERVNWNTLPSRVEAVIARRVGRLPAELQEALKVASVQGESFIAEVVAQVQGIDGTQLVRQLSSIADRYHRLVRSIGSERLCEQLLCHYRFRHILFQKYLHESLDPAERTYLHEAVGSALEAIFTEQTEQVAVQLAYHFEMASLTAKAVEYLRQAAERAAQLSAYEETIAHLNRGLSLLQELPDTLERARQELRLHILHGVSLVAAKGWSSAEVQAAYERASASAQRAGGVHQLVAILHGLYSISHVGGDVHASLAIGKQCLELAKTENDPALLIAGHYMMMAPSVHLGELSTAHVHAQRGLELYEPHQHSFLVSTFTVDVGIFTAVYGSHCTWYLGKADTALAQCRQAAVAAREISHLFSLTVVQAYLAMLHGFRREWRQAQEWAIATDALSTEHVFPYYHAWATYVQGWALTEQGEQERGIALMEQAMADYRAMRTGLREPFYLAHLGEAYAKTGDASKGLHLLEEALAAARKHGERVHEAEIWRLRGEFLQLQGDATDAVEASFRQAIETAGRQEAKALELRATVSLCRLWQTQGKQREASTLLAEIYGWFTEGFDTPDLTEAKTLLTDLSRSGAEP